MMRIGVTMTAMATVAVMAPAVACAQDAAGVPSLARLLAAPRLDPAGVDALYRRAVVEDAGAALDRQVAAAAARADATAPVRARALLIGALLAWQDGRIDDAATAADAALALDPGIDAQLLRARVFDAIGRPVQAAPFYTAAAAAARDPDERRALQLRAAIAAQDGDASALAPLAAQGSAGERRGIADLLGVLGDPAAALAAYRPVAAGAPAYSAQLRMAQWAIAAGDVRTATAATWAASRAAVAPADRRYALALLAEGFRKGRDLPGLLAFLAGKPTSPDIDQLRIDTLVELGRLDEALAVLRGSSDPALRAQLPGLLDLSGQRQALIAEYERLIARQPAALRWYEALAVLYLSTGDRDRAIGVFRRLFAANPADTALRTEAARRMIAMGLMDAGLALLGSGRAGQSVALRLFQFESEAAQGRDDAAAAVLADLDRSLPPRDDQRIAVADGYERLDRDADALRVLVALERAGQTLGFDEQIRIARLQQDARQEQAALDRLVALWFATTLPAQRGFVEQRIVEVARAIDRIDAVSDQIRARIAGGDDEAVELYVALRLARNDSAGARAAIDRFAATAAGSPDRLRRLAAIYLRTNDRARYRATLTQAIAADPANAATYLQQLVRDIAIPPRRGAPVTVAPGTLDTLLARLTAARRSDPAEARRFAAGIYAAAGQTDRAIVLYRQAVAASASDRDALLGLVNLLNTTGRRAQAVALLQHRAEFAESAADQAQALDALAGVLAATSGGAEADQSPGYALARLSWARRRVYWRLGRGDADAGLYDQLADLSEQIGDTRTQRRAREAALAVEGTQRAATLRQLIALSAGGAVAGDDAAKARYGRRLTALRQAYPADVYADLAGAMLAQGDLAGAERAFGLIEPIPGLVNVDALRGDAYLAANYLPQALAGYSRALLGDRSDAGLILKTAIVQEQVGNAALARDLYWQSLRDTVARLPVVATAPVGAATPYAASLLEGLLFTWPADPAARRPIATALEAMMREAVGVGSVVPWSQAARAQRLLDIARRLAASGRDPAPLAVIDPIVAARFGADELYRRDQAAFRNLTGEPRAATVDASAADWILSALRTQARDGDNAELRLALALDRGDDAALTALFDAAAQDEVARRRALGPREFLYPSPLNAMLAMVAGQLPADRLRSVVLAPLDRAGNREQALFDLYRTAADRLAKLDRSAGAPLLSADRLITLIRTRFNSPTPRRLTLRRRSGAPADPYAAMIARFSTDEQVRLYAGLAEDGQRSGAEPVLVGPLERRLLRTALSADQQATMTAAIGAVMGRAGPVLARVQRLFALADVPAANRPIVIAGARALAAGSPRDAVVRDAIEAYLRDDRATALALLLDAAETPEGEGYAPGIIASLLADEYRRQGAAFLALADPDAAARARFYRRYVQVEPRDYGGTAGDVRLYLDRLTTLEPRNALYVARLLRLLWGEGDRAGFATRLAGYVAANPDERDAAALLQLTQRLLGQDAAAAAVARRSRVDVDDPDVLADLIARVRAVRDGGAGGTPTFLTLFGAVYEAARREKPALPGIAAIERRNRTDPAVTQAADPLDAVISAAADPAKLPATQRGVWRRSAANPDAPDDAAESARARLLERLTAAGLATMPPATVQADPVAAALTATPAIVAELELETRLIAPVARQQQQPLYDLVATGAIRQKTADARLGALLVALDTGMIDAHDMQMLVTLAVRQGTALSAPQLRAIQAAVQRMPSMSARRRILLSQLFARSGDPAAAREWLEAAVLQILYIDTADLGGGDRLATFDTVVESLRTWSDQAAAAAAHAALAARVDRERAIMPPDDVPGPLPPLAAKP